MRNCASVVWSFRPSRNDALNKKGCARTAQPFFSFASGRLEHQIVLHQDPAAILDLLDLRDGVGEVIGL
jgi:hypothetical protein